MSNDCLDDEVQGHVLVKVSLMDACKVAMMFYHDAVFIQHCGGTRFIGCSFKGS